MELLPDFVDLLEQYVEDLEGHTKQRQGLYDLLLLFSNLCRQLSSVPLELGLGKGASIHQSALFIYPEQQTSGSLLARATGYILTLLENSPNHQGLEARIVSALYFIITSVPITFAERLVAIQMHGAETWAQCEGTWGGLFINGVLGRLVAILQNLTTSSTSSPLAPAKEEKRQAVLILVVGLLCFRPGMPSLPCLTQPASVLHEINTCLAHAMNIDQDKTQSTRYKDSAQQIQQQQQQQQQFSQQIQRSQRNPASRLWLPSTQPPVTLSGILPPFPSLETGWAFPFFKAATPQVLCALSQTLLADPELLSSSTLSTLYAVCVIGLAALREMDKSEHQGAITSGGFMGEDKRLLLLSGVVSRLSARALSATPLCLNPASTTLPRLPVLYTLTSAHPVHLESLEFDDIIKGFSEKSKSVIMHFRSRPAQSPDLSLPTVTFTTKFDGITTKSWRLVPLLKLLQKALGAWNKILDTLDDGLELDASPHKNNQYYPTSQILFSLNKIPIPVLDVRCLQHSVALLGASTAISCNDYSTLTIHSLADVVSCIRYGLEVAHILLKPKPSSGPLNSPVYIEYSAMIKELADVFHKKASICSIPNNPRDIDYVPPRSFDPDECNTVNDIEIENYAAQLKPLIINRFENTKRYSIKHHEFSVLGDTVPFSLNSYESLLCSSWLRRSYPEFVLKDSPGCIALSLDSQYVTHGGVLPSIYPPVISTRPGFLYSSQLKYSFKTRQTKCQRKLLVSAIPQLLVELGDILLANSSIASVSSKEFRIIMVSRFLCREGFRSIRVQGADHVEIRNNVFYELRARALAKMQWSEEPEHNSTLVAETRYSNNINYLRVRPPNNINGQGTGAGQNLTTTGNKEIITGSNNSIGEKMVENGQTEGKKSKWSVTGRR